MGLVKTMEGVGVRFSFEGKSIRLGDKVINEEREWKPMWQKAKTCLQKAVQSRRITNYKTKEQQSPEQVFTRKKKKNVSTS